MIPSWAARVREATSRPDTGERQNPLEQPCCEACGVRSHTSAACPLPICDRFVPGFGDGCYRCTYPESMHGEAAA